MARVALEPKWNGVGYFNKGLAPVFESPISRYIDTTGQIKLPGPYESYGQLLNERYEVIFDSKKYKVK